MNEIPLKKLFKVVYGNQFDFNKMTFDSPSINFVSRQKDNLGIFAKVDKYNNIDPFPAGLITVTLGGSYLLSSFVQPNPFYTAQNIKVLEPLTQMTDRQKFFYCLAISANRFRYTSHGREANKTLDSLLLPSVDSIPDWVNSIKLPKLPDSSPILQKNISLKNKKFKDFKYEKIFKIVRGEGARKTDLRKNGKTPFVTSIDSNNGIIGYVNKPAVHPSNVITVNRNGSVGCAYYQDREFCSTEDVHIFIPQFNMNKFIAMYLITLIPLETYRYSYGRKWGIERMNKSTLKLPVTEFDEPDWEFIESFIKSLPYSNRI